MAFTLASYFSISSFFIHSWLNHFAFSKSNLAPPLCTRSMLNLSISSSSENISCSVPSFQPSTASRLINASGKNPSSLNPFVMSLVTGSVQSIAYTGKPRRSPSLLLSLPLPSGFNIRGRCAHCGILSRPKRYCHNRICTGALGSHSSPLKACVIFIR